MIFAAVASVWGFACSSAPDLSAASMEDNDAGRQIRWDAGREDAPSFLANGPVEAEEPEDRSTFSLDGGKNEAGFIQQEILPFTCSRTGSEANGSLVINEIDYDQPGTDELEFVEIYNPGTSAVSLASYEVVFLNGSGTQRDYGHVPLTGTLASKGYLVLADPKVAVASGTTVVRFAQANSVQNGPSDAVAIMKNGQLVDSLSYGGALAEPCDFVEGTATKAYDSNTVVGSLIRDPNGVDTGNADADWKFTTSPTPGAPNALRRGDGGL